MNPNDFPEVVELPQHYRVHDQAYPYFITSTIIYWIPVFCRDDYFRIVADSLTHCATNRGLRIHAYVIMPNHFHAICSHENAGLSGSSGILDVAADSAEAAGGW